MMKYGIVTGSSRGIGLATVALLSENQNFEIIGSSTSGRHSLIRPNFKALKLDLSDSGSIAEFVDKLGDVKLEFFNKQRQGTLLAKMGCFCDRHEPIKTNLQYKCFRDYRIN